MNLRGRGKPVAEVLAKMVLMDGPQQLPSTVAAAPQVREFNLV
jgi:hypothetical protein